MVLGDAFGRWFGSVTGELFDTIVGEVRVDRGVIGASFGFGRAPTSALDNDSNGEDDRCR